MLLKERGVMMENTRYKFRAWHKEGAYMMPVEEIDFEKKLINKSGAWRWFNELVLMQYTGLKDENGVEIFEGDIVRHSKISTDISIVRFGEFGVPNIEEMEYQDMAVGFYFENASDLKDVEPFNMTIPLNNLYVEDIEVIGNIYDRNHLS